MGPIDLLAPEPAGRFSGEPARNAYVELHNLIAAAVSTADFGPSDRVRISHRHGVDLAIEFLAERQALYQRVLDHRLADADLDGLDRELLDHLARTLALSDADLRPAHQRAFGSVAAEAVSDDCLSVEQRLLLYKLQHLLGIDPRLADGAYDVIARERLLKVVADALCDGELSPDEEAEIERVRRDLSLTIPDPMARMLDRARDRHHIRRGRLPETDVGLTLKDGEVGRYRGPAQWCTLHGGYFRRSIGEVRLSTGRTANRLVPDAVLQPQATGEVVLTDRRLILLDPPRVPDDMRVPALVQLLRFRNGTVVRTGGDRYVFIDPGEANETFYAILHGVRFGRGNAGPD